MENPAADRLPEADSLPDGFVESSAEPLAPSTPALEQERPSIDYKEEKLVEADLRPELIMDAPEQERPSIDYKEEKLVDADLRPELIMDAPEQERPSIDYKEEKLVDADLRPELIMDAPEQERPSIDYKEEKLVDADLRPELIMDAPEQERPSIDYKEEKLVEADLRPELIMDAFQLGKDRTQETEKLRTFPVQLSGDESFDHLGEGENVRCAEQSECTLVMTESAKPIHRDAAEQSVELLTGSSRDEGQAEAKRLSPEKSIEESLDGQAVHMKEVTSSVQNIGKAEIAEVKRKTTKRSFKSEKEFLEFTLKYQQVLAERDGAIAVRDKLESLCRELQRQNKMLMDECKRVSTEGQNLRLDLSTRFQDAIKEVGHKLDEQKDECLSQLKENEMLRNKLKQFAEQYALSEQQYAHKLKQKTLELQIADLKIQQHEEKLIQEQSQMKLYAEQVSQLLATEKNLRLQLTADGEKFQQFQEALVKSNEVFETFKQEIEKMAKSIKELKKENTFLKSKCEKSDVTLIELVEERERLKKQVEKTRNQKEKLESLCRSLQAERKQNPVSHNSSESVSTLNSD